MPKTFIGELIGTFVLVFFGCGIVGLSIILPDINLFVIALVWGLGVYLGIVSSVRFSKGHLNPAVSLGFLALGEINLKQFFQSIAGQLSGAFLSGLVLFVIFNPFLRNVEAENGWERTEISGLNTARMFGEFYNPEHTSLFEAVSVEAFGTFLLLIMIFTYARYANTNPKLVVFFISLTVSVLIVFIAPITQCGINPARDLSPRLVSYLMGWKHVFYLPDAGAILAYVAGPLIGGLIAGVGYRAYQFLTIN